MPSFLVEEFFKVQRVKVKPSCRAWLIHFVAAVSHGHSWAGFIALSSRAIKRHTNPDNRCSLSFTRCHSYVITGQLATISLWLVLNYNSLDDGGCFDLVVNWSVNMLRATYPQHYHVPKQLCMHLSCHMHPRLCSLDNSIIRKTRTGETKTALCWNINPHNIPVGTWYRSVKGERLSLWRDKVNRPPLLSATISTAGNGRLMLLRMHEHKWKLWCQVKKKGTVEL